MTRSLHTQAFFTFFFTATLFAMSLSLSSPALAKMAGIVATVNDDAISGSDLEDRLRLIMTSSGMPNTPDVRQKVMPQVLGTLIDEQLMIQEAERLEIGVDDAEVEEGFARLAAQNKFESDQFKEMIARGGINIATMNRQIKAQIAWSKVIQSLLRPKIDITENDITAQLERINNQLGMTEYLLAEIYLPVDNPEEESDTRQLAQKLRADLAAGRAPFPQVAQQFSRAAGAAQGGMIGWVQPAQMEEKLAEAVQALDKGALSEVIRSLGGYHLLLVRDKRTIEAENLPDQDAVLQQLGLERLERLQRRHLQDLKLSAFIERRLEF